MSQLRGNRHYIGNITGLLPTQITAKWLQIALTIGNYSLLPLEFCKKNKHLELCKEITAEFSTATYIGDIIRMIFLTLHPVCMEFMTLNDLLLTLICITYHITSTLLWRHNGRDGVPNHQLHDCLLNRSFRPRSKKTSKLHVTALCAGNSQVTGEFPAQMASNTEDVSIWWRHHEMCCRFHSV